MLTIRTPHLLLFSALFLYLGGCETAPVQEMSDARQAIQVAREAGAADVAAAALSSAEQSLLKAETELSQRDYANARLAAMEAKHKALDALKVAEAERDQRNN